MAKDFISRHTESLLNEEGIITYFILGREQCFVIFHHGNGQNFIAVIFSMQKSYLAEYLACYSRFIGTFHCLVIG